LDTGPAGGAANMALDEALLKGQQSGDSPPTLRFYAWQPATISLGYFQDPVKELDLNACRRLGIPWVKRITGGRAILHDLEVTYSLTAPEDHPLVKGTILESYLKVSRGLAAGLRNLGVPAEIVEKKSGRAESGVCFEAPSWYELAAEGKKLVGSAQTRKFHAVLQHGSIPLATDPEKLYAVFRLEDETRRKLIQKYPQRATSVSAVLGRKADYGEVRDAVIRGFQELGLELVPGELTAREINLAEELKPNHLIP